MSYFIISILSKLSASFADKQYFNTAKNIEIFLFKLFHHKEHNIKTINYSIYQYHLKNLSRTQNHTSEYPVFVINRKVDKKTFDNITKRCKTLGINITRFEAIDSMNPDFDFKPYTDYIGLRII